MGGTRKKVLCLMVSAALLTGLLGACSTQKEVDPVQQVMGYPGSTVMMTVNGNDVTAADFFLWMAQSADYVSQYYTTYGMDLDWSADLGGQTVDDYVKQEAVNTSKLFSILEVKAAEEGYTFTDEDQESYESDKESAVQSMGSEQAYNDYLLKMCTNESGMAKASRISTLYSHMEDAVSNDAGAFTPTDEEMDTYIQENDLLRAKHILLATKDPDTGEEYTDEVKAQKKTQAEDLLRQLKASDEPETLFDTLMNQYSEDPGLSSNPDGYTFTAGQMVDEFESATRALEVGGISGIVQSDYGYHIILRLDPDTESLRQQWSDEQKSSYVSDTMNEKLDGWLQEAEVETTSYLDDLTTQDFYDKLTAYRATFTEEDSADSSTDTSGETGDTATNSDTDTTSQTGDTAASPDTGTSSQTDGSSNSETGSADAGTGGS